MKITFSKNINDHIWLMRNNKPTEGVISKALFNHFRSCVDYETIISAERYQVSFIDNKSDVYDLGDIFDTKDDLIKSL